MTLSAPPVRRGSGEPPGRRGVGDDVHVDVAGLADDGRADPRSGERRGQPSAPADADHELRGVHRPRELDESTRHVVADDLVVRAAERFHERALLGQGAGRRRAQTVLSRHVDGQQLASGRAGGDAGAAADERLTFGPAGQRHDDPFARLPGALDPVLGPVQLECAVDLVREPQQREFTERGEVAEPEVVRQRGIDPLGGVDEARREPVAQRLRCEVDDLDLVGGADDGIRHRLALRRLR